YRIHLPETHGGAIRLDFFEPLPDTENVRRGTAYMNPVSGNLLGLRVFGEAWINTLYSLHSGLILGRAGIAAAGLIGLVLGLLPLLGLWLWTHHDGRPWRESLTPQRGWRGLRRLRNWHRALGAWAALPLLLAALTGFGLAFPETVREWARPWMAEPETGLHPGPATPGLAAAMARAEALVPGFRTVWIDLPLAGSKEPTALILRPADGSLSGPAIAETSPALGKAMQVTRASDVETLRAWIMALHNGHAMGLGHRLFVVALGLAPAALGVLGWLAWRRRQRARQRAQAPGMMGQTSG
ncbi:MAG: PepSY domain-containing protein, partial [Roseococcus sp.]